MKRRFKENLRKAQESRKVRLIECNALGEGWTVGCGRAPAERLRAHARVLVAGSFSCIRTRVSAGKNDSRFLAFAFSRPAVRGRASAVCGAFARSRSGVRRGMVYSAFRAADGGARLAVILVSRMRARRFAAESPRFAGCLPLLFFRLTRGSRLYMPESRYSRLCRDTGFRLSGARVPVCGSRRRDRGSREWLPLKVYSAFRATVRVLCFFVRAGDAPGWREQVGFPAVLPAW